MKTLLNILIFTILFIAKSFGQTNINGQVIDSQTKEALVGVIVSDKQNNIATSDLRGKFELRTNGDSIKLLLIGYKSKTVKAENNLFIRLEPYSIQLNSIVVSASREEQKRSEAPIAISNISAQTINDTKPTTIDQVLDKVSGVHMVNLGNEQHNMSIRQPLSYSSLFLYLEDGVPMRTSGLFNHNALVETNMAAVKNIEIIRGPASSLYGQEAVGGAINFITLSPTPIPTGRISIQGNDIGYKRGDLNLSNTFGKLGIAVSGYYANRKNGVLEQSDFNKTAATLRADYHFNEKTVLDNSISYVKYYSDMGGGVDSLKFARKDYSDFNTFTYRDVYSLRAKSALSHFWNNNSKTTFTAVFRDNSIKQNPAYSISNDKGIKGVRPANPLLANGQLNNAFFKSYALIAQHRQSFNWKKSVFILGASSDYSPSGYIADYIRINRSADGHYINYENIDSSLSDYRVNVLNNAMYSQFEFSPLEKLRLVFAGRYDNFIYDYKNNLSLTASSGAPNSKNTFTAFSPKVGLTYDLGKGGFYGNYSKGFVPPQITELYRAVKVPELMPANFYNYELGGWAGVIKDKIYTDLSIYQLNGVNEIISVRADDGTYSNRNAGKTRHEGIEYGINYKPIEDFLIRISGSNAKHTYLSYIENGKDYSGKEMPNAPRWISNAEVVYKPHFLKGSRISVEMQHLNDYFMDQSNTVKYPGYNIFNIRLGYEYKSMETWVNVINTGDLHYATIASKTQYGYSYNYGEPRNINIGLTYKFARKN